jgi:fructose-bisphosphate aldolase class II
MAPICRFEENIRTTRRIVEIAHDFGIPVEAELGKIPDAGESVNWEDYYTDVGEAKRFVEETGVDYLAISVGIVHGVVPGVKPQPLAIKRTLEIRDAVGIPLVLHGASGIPEDEVQAAKCGRRAQVQCRHRPAPRLPRRHAEDVWSKGDHQLEEAMAEGRKRMVAATVEKMKLYGCAGKAPKAKA